ncbi:hypothetical protein CLV35_1224 [Motilibacter peucedani]|uniref:Uncharacterized protein n=1 Tax=Motilibacter peucedani TaxID=598650 RepID=A0A420XRM2_9ACTN|nr:hypothetical protein [Motilibacter peucedani]RKS77535.1 hypothetical protein CLV35_1224 [Motilibacter peucedani]
MALLRSDAHPSERWLRRAAPAALAVLTGGAVLTTVVAVHRPLLWAVAGPLFAVALCAAAAWGAAVRLRRSQARQGRRRVGQWVRSARIHGGQVDGLAAVRAGAPLTYAEHATGWLCLEHEVLRFLPSPRCDLPGAAWSVPWESIAVVDVRPAADLRTRLVPGLHRSIVTLRFRAPLAQLVVQVDDDPLAVLRAWQWYGVGERPARQRGADR